MIRLECPGCQAAIPAGDVSLENRAARCVACDAIFTFTLPAPSVEALPVESRPRIPSPRGVEVVRRDKGLGIERSWFGFQVVPMIGFTVAWDSFLVMWYGAAISQGQWFMGIFATAHLMVGLALTYGCLTGLLNVTRIGIEGGRLRVTHGPIPYPGGQDLDVREIDQLYARRVVAKSDDSTTETYELRVLLKDRRHVVLLGELPDSDQALYLEQELEGFLGIPDRRIEGELERPALPAAPFRAALPSGAEPARAPAGGGELRVGEVETLAEGSCPVCRETAGPAPRRCPACGVAHHPECWSYNGGCATYGCREAREGA